jgi:hypothetical protein
MKLPAVQGVIDRRILVNFRVEPERLASVLPPGFSPLVVNGSAMGGVCLIRLTNIRPRGLPAALGVSSENAAHRFAVHWNESGQMRTGVYIPRRDTNLRLNAWVGGRLFPGVHHRSSFDVQEADGEYRVGFRSPDGEAISVHVRRTEHFADDSVFRSLQEASAFYESGSCGYSPGRVEGRMEGLELRTERWQVEPLEIQSVKSNYFDTLGGIADNALLMTGIDHEWHSLDPIGP